MASSELQPGTVINDYRFEEVLGAGGFGVTYRAVDMRDGRVVAIKEYFPRTAAVRQNGQVFIASEQHADSFNRQLNRFWEEAQTLARFNHPGIVKVLHRFLDNGTAYIVLEYLDGLNVEQWAVMVDREPTPDEIEPFIAALLDALEVVHSRAILHRDIAPKNILLRDGRPVLIDFGSSRLIDPSKPMTAMITANYAPCEQYLSSGQGQGPFTDIYAAAATAYRLIARRPPVDAVTRSVDESQYKPLIEIGRNRYRHSFLAALDWGLKFRPDERPQTIAQWRGPLLQGASITNHSSGLSIAATIGTDPRSTVFGRVRDMLGRNR